MKKTFQTFNNQLNHTETISENWISKGFALIEGAAHRSNRQKVISLASQMKSFSNAAKQQRELLAKLDNIAQALETLSAIHSAAADMSGNIISIEVGNSILSENVADAVERALKSTK